jgi:AcrR family transcriptional regulator
VKEELKDSSKEKIINSTAEIINNEGIDELTTRKVAANSGVNVAAINYYFGTKEKLIVEVINFIFEKKVPEIFSILEKTEYSTEERLYLFFRTYIRELSKHPGILKTIITSFLKGKMEYIDRIFFIKESLNKMSGLISEHLGITDKRLVSIRMMHIMSAILFPNAMYKFYPKIFEGIKISEKETRDLYIDILLNNTLNIDVEKVKNKMGDI